MTKQFKYRLSSIDVLTKTVVYPPGGKEFKPETEVNFNFILDIQVDKERKLAFALTTITISPIYDLQLIVAQLRTVLGFDFKEFEEIFVSTDEEGRYITPVELEILMKTIAYSTTRGILYSELRGTFLQSAILPVYDVASLIIADNKKKDEAKKMEKT